MIKKPAITLEPRDAEGFLAAILARRAGFTPEWAAPDKSAGRALAAICARYLHVIAERLNQAPDKNKLAFLDAAQLSLIPAQAARAPLVFELGSDATGGAAPAHTPVAAQGESGQILFETERALGVTAGKLVEVFSLWPGRDEYIDHSQAFLAGSEITPFASAERQPVPHHLFLSHPVLLALAGNVEIGVEFELAYVASSPLRVAWEYWDGQVWRGFLDTSRECAATSATDLDSTNGLTESGRFLLRADQARAQLTSVNGVSDYWLRGRLLDPLPPDADQVLPEVDGIRLTSTVNRALRGSVRVAEPEAIAGAERAKASLAISPSSLRGLVTNEAGFPVAGAIVQLVDPSDPGKSAFTSQATGADGSYRIENVSFGREYLYRVLFAEIEFSGPVDQTKPREAASEAKPRVDLVISVEGLALDKAFADGTTLDVSKPFYPLGQQPQPGSTFYFGCEEAFAKPGARVRLYLARTRSPQDEATLSAGSPLAHQLAWEYWNGRTWALLPVRSSLARSLLDLNQNELVDFVVPIDMEPSTQNGEVARWVRVRLQSGSYGVRQEVTFQTGNDTNSFTYVVTQPPVLAACRIGYTWQYGPFHPKQVFTWSDFSYRDRTEAAIWPGTTFLPFERVADITPALYLGFDKPAPADVLGLFFDIVEAPDTVSGPALVWEYWNGYDWRRLPAEDETGRLRRPGIVSLLMQSDDEKLARFGRSLNFVRARLQEDGPPGEPRLSAIFPNAVWASERRTLRDLTVGASDGTPNQVLSVAQTPILNGEVLEVRELEGARANVEWRILAMELFDGDAHLVAKLEASLGQEATNLDVAHGVLRLRRNRRKEVTETWVRWENRPSLANSGPHARHYALDRSLGRLYLGDGEHGKIPDAGALVVLRETRSGGGAAGNVAARAIKQLLGVVPGVQAVFNPRAAEGGADGETGAAALERGPFTIRHRGRAVGAKDYETLAREASPAVAIARALAGRDPAGVVTPGWITLLVVPHGNEARPYPSFGLREHVRKFLEARAPSDIAALHRIHVTGPVYRTVDVTTTVVPLEPSQAGVVERAVRATLERFLHPLLGGPAGEGWELGRDVYLSDVATELERTPGVDYVESLGLQRDGVPQGESFAVDDAEIVAAGTITIRLKDGRN